MKPSDYGLPDDADGYAAIEAADDGDIGFFETLGEAVGMLESECLNMYDLDNPGAECVLMAGALQHEPDPTGQWGAGEWYMTTQRVEVRAVLRYEVQPIPRSPTAIPRPPQTEITSP